MRYLLLFFYVLTMGFSLPVANAAVQKNYSPVQPKTIFKASKKAKKAKKTDPYVILGLVAGAVTLVVGIFARLPVIWIMGIILFTVSLAGLIILLI